GQLVDGAAADVFEVAADVDAVPVGGQFHPPHDPVGVGVPGGELAGDAVDGGQAAPGRRPAPAGANHGGEGPAEVDDAAGLDHGVHPLGPARGLAGAPAGDRVGQRRD